MKSTTNVPVPGRAPLDSPQGVEVGKDPKYRNIERSQNFPTGTMGVNASGHAWASNSTPDADYGPQGSGSG